MDTKTKTKKSKRLDIIVTNEIKTDLNKVQYDEGKFDLHEYILATKSAKYRNDMFQTCWKIHTVKEVTTRSIEKISFNWRGCII